MQTIFNLSASNCPGKVLIFNQFKFLDQNVTQRDGTEEDVAHLSYEFSKLQFEHQTYQNKTVQQIHDLIQKHANEDYKDFGCVIVIVLTHGHRQGILHAYDGKFNTNDVWEPFIKCETLKDKPKIFIFQACRGDDKEIKTTLMTDVNTTHFIIPREKDCLVAYSTIEGKVSHRSTTEGSWYVQTLTEELKNFKEGVDFVSLLIRVNNLVVEYFKAYINYENKVSYFQEEGDDEIGQTPVFVSSMSKPVMYNETTGISEVEYAMCHENRGQALVIYDARNEKLAIEMKDLLQNLQFTPEIIRASSIEDIKDQVKENAEKSEGKGCFLLAILLPLRNETISVAGETMKTYDILKCLGYTEVKNIAGFPKIVLFFNQGPQIMEDTIVPVNSQMPKVTTEFSDVLVVRAYNTDRIKAIQESISKCLLEERDISVRKDIISCLTPCLNKDAHIESTLRQVIVLRKTTSDEVSREFMKNSMGLQRTTVRLSCKDYVGRISENEILKQRFEANEYSNNIDILVHGLPGVGKTELVYKFLESSNIQESSVIWIHAASKQSIIDSFKTEAKKLDIPGDINSELVQKIYSKHIEIGTKVLVFDEATPLVDNMNDYLPSKSFMTEFFVIFTSFSFIVNAQQDIELHFFSDTEARAFVRQHVSDEDSVNKICNMLKPEHDNCPIKLKQITESYTKIGDVVDDNIIIPINIEETRYPAIRHHYNKNTKNMYDLLIKCLEKSNDGQMAIKIFQILAVIDNDTVEAELFQETTNRGPLELLQKYSMIRLENNTIKTDVVTRQVYKKKYNTEKEKRIKDLVDLLHYNIQDTKFKTSSLAKFVVKSVWKKIVVYPKLKNKLSMICIAIFKCKEIDIETKEKFATTYIEQITLWLERSDENENVLKMFLKLINIYYNCKKYDKAIRHIQDIFNNTTKHRIVTRARFLEILCKGKTNLTKSAATSSDSTNEFIEFFKTAMNKSHPLNELAKSLRDASFLFSEKEHFPRFIKCWGKLLTAGQNDNELSILKQLLKCIRLFLFKEQRYDQIVHMLSVSDFDVKPNTQVGQIILDYKAHSLYLMSKHDTDIMKLEHAFATWKYIYDNKYTPQLIDNMYHLWETVHILGSQPGCTKILKEDIKQIWMEDKIPQVLTKIFENVDNDEVSVMLLKLLRKARQDKSKEDALSITQRIISCLPENLREKVLYSSKKIVPGPVEYISGLEMEHGSKVLGWLDHYLSKPLVKYLVDSGAEINASDKNGNTILHKASLQGRIDIVKYLISHQADVNIINNNAWSPQHDIKKPRSWFSLCNFFPGKDKFIKNKRIGSTPLHYAAMRGYFHVVEYLIANNADINIRNKYGWNVLHLSAYWGFLNIVEYLVKVIKIDISIKNSDGHTALDLAKQEKQHDIVACINTYST